MKKLAVVFAIVVIIAGGFLLLRKEDDQRAGPSSQSQVTPDDEQQPAHGEQTVSPVIIYDGDSFDPETIRITSGERVTIRNNSSRTLDFASDPHPSHTENQELNVGSIPPGESAVFTPERTGTFSFHDHLNPSATGEIVVENDN